MNAKLDSQHEKEPVELDKMYDYACFLCDQNRIQEGITVAEKLHAHQSEQGVSEETLANTEDLLAQFFYKNKQYEKAITLCRRALERRKKISTESPREQLPPVSNSCNNLALLLTENKQYDEAEALYREALAIDKALLDNGIKVAVIGMVDTINNLASLLRKTERLEEAEKLHKKALEIRRKMAEQNSVFLKDVAISCNNLANLYCDLGQSDDAAETFYTEALGIYKTLAAKNPNAYLPDIASTSKNLAVLLKTTNRFKEARPLLLEALDIYTEFDMKEEMGIVEDLLLFSI